MKLDLKIEVISCTQGHKMNILQILCCIVLSVHIVGVTSTDCTTKIYPSENGFSCYPCPPGFYVDKECMENATNNKCKPCPTGEFHSTCANTSKTCQKCGDCQNKQIITRKCTTTKDNTCACKKEYPYWDILEHACKSTCQPGKKITRGDEGEGLLCVPCEADTFSNERNSHKCEQCSMCLDYKKNCTKTSDTVCNQLTTKTVPTKNVISPTTTTDRLTSITTSRKGSSSTCEESNHGERGALIAVLVLFALCIGTVTVLIACKWLKISTKFPCWEKTRQNAGEPDISNHHGAKGEKEILLKPGEKKQTANEDHTQNIPKQESGTSTVNGEERTGQKLKNNAEEEERGEKVELLEEPTNSNQQEVEQKLMPEEANQIANEDHKQTKGSGAKSTLTVHAEIQHNSMGVHLRPELDYPNLASDKTFGTSFV